MKPMTLPLAALALALAAPGFAQPAPSADASTMAGPDRMSGRAGRRMAAMFEALSPEGRRTMVAAMAAAGDTRRADHDRVRAARDRMMGVLEADRLDTTALKRAMDDEQAASTAARDRMQDAMIAGFSKLSTADRRAFVAYGRAMKNRMEARMQQWQARRGRGGMDGNGLLPPPPPPLP